MHAAAGTSSAVELTVIEHSPDCPLDRMTAWLDGVEVQVLRPYRGDAVPEAAAVGAGLIVLGGHFHAYDDEAAPWLPATRDLLAAAVRAEVPTLGICLGAQLLAVAAGGAVQVAAPPGREAGVVDVRWRPETTDDALLADLGSPSATSTRSGPTSAAASMHADAVVDLPRDAVWLGATRMYPYQAFRIGSSAWGVQFHPEVGAETFARWAAKYEDVDADAVTADFRARQDELTATGRALAGRFAALVRARATQTTAV